MPTTLSGLLLFVVLLLPGLCYVVRLERGTRPGKSSAITAFRETVTVVVASVLALAIVGVLFAILRVAAPGETPDVGRLVRGDYLRTDYDYLALWSVGLVVVAMLLAYLAARFDVNRWIEKKILREPKGGQRPQSAWYTVFEDDGAQHDHRKKYLVCRLTDGTEFEGALASYNPVADETSDREFVIAQPYVMRRADGTVQRFDFGGVILSARNLVWIRFEFLLDNEVQARFETWARPQSTAAAVPSGG